MCGYSKQFSVLCMYVSWHARAMGIIIVTFFKTCILRNRYQKIPQLPANFSKSSIQSPLQYVVLHFIYPFWMTPPGIACNCIEIAQASTVAFFGLKYAKWRYRKFISKLSKFQTPNWKIGSVALLWHNAKVLALLKVKCEIH